MVLSETIILDCIETQLYGLIDFNLEGAPEEQWECQSLG